MPVATTTNTSSVPATGSVQATNSSTKTGQTLSLASLKDAIEPTSEPSKLPQAFVSTFPTKSTVNMQPMGMAPSSENAALSSTTGIQPAKGFSFNMALESDSKSRPSTSSSNPGSNFKFSFENSSTGHNQLFPSGNPWPQQTTAEPGKVEPTFSFTSSTNNASGPPMKNFNFSQMQMQSSMNMKPEHVQPMSFNNSHMQQMLSTATPPQAMNDRNASNSKILASSQNSQPPIETLQTNNASRSLKQTTQTAASNTQHTMPLNSQEADEPEVPLSRADASLLEKKINTKLRDQSELIVDRSDPNSPLYSLKSFEELKLRPELLKGIYSMGFRKPSKIQEITLPMLLNEPSKNVIAQSQSGTGKTAAFSLAILSRIDPSIQIVQAIILTPTFELALQIGSVITEMAKFLPYIKIAYGVRNSESVPMPRINRGQLLTEPIVVGTPGTLSDWCFKKRVIDLSKLRICCVDEADVMIATEGFQQTCFDLVKNVDRSSCQMMLYSATYSDEVMEFARQIVPNPIVLRLRREKQTLNNIQQYFVKCVNTDDKYSAITSIYQTLNVGQAMVFCRTKKEARNLSIRMANEQYSIRELTAALTIDQRASVIQQFRQCMFRVLISTNVTSRGIDIDDVSLVINYDMPITVNGQPDYETYLHRIGRCGRFGKIGYAFNLIGSEADYCIMKEIEKYFNCTIQEITPEGINHLVSEDD